jgi:hypothetical protein
MTCCTPPRWPPSRCGAGLTPATAAKAARHLRTLVGAIGLSLTDCEKCLAYDGRGGHHSDQFDHRGAAGP